MKRFTSLFFILLASLSLYSQIVINEYMCSNRNSFTDNFGEYEDWFELYNTTGSTIDISGYYFSDKLTDPTKWQVPNGVTIPANGHLVVYCSSRGVVSGGQVHAGFKLTQTKPETIVVTDASGSPVTFKQLEPNQLGHSYGLDTDGGSNWVVYTNPTLGTSNGSGNKTYAETPQFSQPAGNYNGSVSVSLSTSDPGQQIRYTLDGSEPTSSSTLYSSAINISSTTVLRAANFSTTTNKLTSFIETNTYFIDESHEVKVVSLSGGDYGGDGVKDLLEDNLGWGADDPAGTFELFDKDMNLLTEGTGNFNKHGNDSWFYDQRGLDYITRDEFGYNYAIEDTLFNGKERSKFQRIMLKAGASDNYPFEWGGAHVRDAYVQSLSQIGDLKLDERSHEPCVVYVDGDYWGVYELREKVDDHDFTSYYYGQGKDDIDFIKTWGATWAEYGSMNDWNNLYNFITTNNMAVQSNFEYVDSLFNWHSLIDYTCLNSYTVCKDMLNWNTAWWRGKNPNGDKKKWRYVLWDMDAVYGHYINYTGIPDESMAADPCNIENSPSIDDPEGHMVILNALLANPIVDQYYTSRYIDLGNTVFSCEFQIAHLDSLVALIDPEMQAHCNRWGGSYAGWQANVQAFRDSILLRCVALDTGLEDCYNIEGPYHVAYNVDPPGAGDMDINSLNPTTYPYSGDYFAGIDINLNAHANTGYVFQYWEVINFPDSILDPGTYTTSTTSDPAVLRLGGADSVIAHFVTLDTVLLSFDVTPLASGDIDIDGFVPGTYAHTDYYAKSIPMTLEAIPQSGYTFSHWTSDNGTAFVASSTDNPVTITPDTADNIVAHFDALDTLQLTFDVAPTGGGDISIAGFTPSSYAYSDYFAETSVLNLVATPQVGYVFSHWTSSNGTTFSPSTTDNTVSITVTVADQITAHFNLDVSTITFDVQPEQGGRIFVDSVSLGNSYTVNRDLANNYTYKLEAKPNQGFSFIGWLSSEGQNFNPAPDTNIVDYTVTMIDTITALFAPDTFEIKYNVTLVGGGDIAINGNIPTSYIHTEQVVAGTVIDLEAINTENFVFDHWETQNHDLLPDLTDLEVSFTVFGIDSIIAVFLELPPEGIFVPMAFSPNNDGNNDFLYVYGEQITEMSIQIYDRWGKMVFSSTDQLIGWDGKWNDKDVNPGVYYYKVSATFQNGNSESKAGDVTLVR